MEPDGLVGSTFVGRFRIDKVLGKGGMAIVYAAFDQKRSSPVALKVLKKDLTRDAMVVRRFQREAKAASHLRHPNVVEVLDWGVEGEEAFIAMELAQGTDLLKALARQRPMKQVRVVLVLAQVCSALSAAHAKGIVHRDLKPENILLVPDPLEPGGERAKVLDFGIAKILDVGKGGASGDDPPSYVTKTALTRVGTIVGTPAYMSPEQCRGGDIDGRSDVYACGVLLYQLVTGELPFTGETPLHTAMRHIHAQPRPPSELRKDLSPALERVIAKALSKWPGERHQSADVLREELLATLPTLPDRDQVTLPDSFGAAVSATVPAAAPAGDPAAPPAPSELASTSEPALETPIDATQPTRHLVGGALGATPLKAVRLGGPMELGPSSGGPAASLQPSTTRPDVPISEDEEPRTAAMDMFDESSSEHDEDGLPTNDPLEAPAAFGGRAPEPAPAAPPRVVVHVKTDPMERRSREQATTMVAEPAAAQTAVAASAAPRTAPAAEARPGAQLSGLGATPLRALPAEAKPAAGVVARVPAKTERTAPAPKVPPRVMKATQTGLTPTMNKAPPRAGGPSLAAAASPIAPSVAVVSAPAEAFRAEPAGGDDDEPATYVREHAAPTGKTLVMEDPASVSGAAQLRQNQAALEAPRPAAGAPPISPHPSAAVQPSNAMRSQPVPIPAPAPSPVQQAAPPHAPQQLASQHAAPQQPPPHQPTPQQASAQHAPPAHAPQQAAPHPMASSYSSQENDLRGLKATARIQDEHSTGGQVSFASTGDSLQGVKATMRMSPQEAVAPHGGRPPSVAPSSQDASGRSIPQPPPSSGGHDPSLGAGYRQLPPGGWNEPTVVKRRSPAAAPPKKEGMISLLQGLSGTTGLLIGIGLGLGIAAGLLIVFLLYVS